MARLNTRPTLSTVGSSRYGSATPAPGDHSDLENTDPSMPPPPDKGKGRATDPSERQRSSLPTPTSDGSSDARGQKRKRGQSANDVGEDEEEREEDEEYVKYFDPNQDQDRRREVKRKSRALEREFQERRDDMMRDQGDGLTHTIRAANNLFSEVRQTNDATLDSRLLVNVSDLANKKTAQMVLGDGSAGIDMDEFISKCITFMRHGGPLDRDAADVAPSTARRRRTRPRDDSDDEDEDDFIGESLDWEVLGRDACFPNNARPCVPSFLYGPLSVEKKKRTQTQRRARQSKDTSGREARPENLSRAEMSQSDENSLTAICTRIRKHLQQHISAAEKSLEKNGIRTQADLQSSRAQELLAKLRLSDTGGVSLFDYVLNPRSFGQTVENLFYVSFLIKEGSVGVSQDSKGLPTLQHATPQTLDQQRQGKTSKHQAVMALDYGIWRELVDAFDVRTPLIPHRTEESQPQVGERGWYT